MVDERAADWAVLVLLLDDCLPWSTDEIAREISDHTAASESVNRLCRAGLVHRCNNFVFATRSARRFEELRA